MKGEHRRMTLAEAQKAIEFESTDTKGRMLREELIARERQLGCKIMTRREYGTRTSFRVTIAAIRKHAPDLMPSKADELLREARVYMVDVRRELEDHVAEQIASRCNPRFERIERTQQKTAETVRDMSVSLNQLIGATLGGSPSAR